jgi:hypothetical protein
MLHIISKICSIADKLEDVCNRDDLSDRLDKIANQIFNAYVIKIRKQRKTKGVRKLKRKLYYKMNRTKMNLRMKMYRRIHKYNLKKRKTLKHFHRFG